MAATLATTAPLSGCRRAARQVGSTIGVSDPDYTEGVRQALSSGHMDDLRWPNFSDLAGAVNAFYTQRNYDLAWSKDGKPTAQASALMQLFSNARERGLEPEDYDASRWSQRVLNLQTDAGKISFDTAMTVTAARFVTALHSGRVDPNVFAFGIKIDSKQMDLPAVLNQQIANAGDVDGAVRQLEPQSPQYAALKGELQRYLALAAEDHSQPLPDPGKASFSVTPSYPAMDDLLAKLQLLGDLGDAPAAAATSTPGPTATPVTDPERVTDALKHFQHRHGIAEDGKLNHDTVAALNVPVAERIQQIDDTLERWRWLDDEHQHPAVLVNLPEFELRTFDGDTEQFRMRVVDGQSSKEEHHTPLIQDEMRYLVFRPYWNVPVDIAKKEIVPHILKNPDYLSEHNYEAVNGKGEPQEASVERIEHGGVMVREKPGTGNSLGLVKFMFPNQFNVYLHDTNSHSLFQRTRRDYSHGCVRVQDPPKLAEWLLRNNPKWDAQAIQDAMSDDTKDNKTVSLGKPVPVVLFYATAYVDNGEIHFYRDLYGYDRDLETSLKKGMPYPKKAVKVRGEASV